MSLYSLPLYVPNSEFNYIRSGRPNREAIGGSAASIAAAALFQDLGGSAIDLQLFDKNGEQFIGKLFNAASPEGVLEARGSQMYNNFFRGLGIDQLMDVSQCAISTMIPSRFVMNVFGFQEVEYPAVMIKKIPGYQDLGESVVNQLISGSPLSVVDPQNPLTTLPVQGFGHIAAIATLFGDIDFLGNGGNTGVTFHSNSGIRTAKLAKIDTGGIAQFDNAFHNIDNRTIKFSMPHHAVPFSSLDVGIQGDFIATIARIATLGDQQITNMVRASSILPLSASMAIHNANNDFTAQFIPALINRRDRLTSIWAPEIAVFPAINFAFPPGLMIPDSDNLLQNMPNQQLSDANADADARICPCNNFCVIS